MPERPSIQQESKLEVEHSGSTRRYDTVSIVRELAQVRRLDIPLREQADQLRDVLGRHGQGHALLALTDPDLPRRHPRILEWHAVEVQTTTAAFTRHLGNGT